MTDRSSSAVAIKVTDIYGDHRDRTWYVGPFLPHAGSKTVQAVGLLDSEAESVDGLRSRDLDIVTLFLASGESDLKCST